MDIQVESSMVLAAMIAVLLAFIVPSLIRRGRNAAQPAMALAATGGNADAAGPAGRELPLLRVADPDTAAPADTVRHTTDTARTRRNTMATPARPRTAAPRQASFRIRYGRLAVALTGALAAVVLVAGVVLAPFGVVSGIVPLVAAIVLAGAFVGLRALAVRDRRRKVLARMEEVFNEAMHAAPEAAVVHRRTTAVFDARETAPTREAAIDAAPTRRPAAPAPAPMPETWEPIEVPKPTYVGAAKAKRPAPEPLPAPEQKKPEHVTSILQETRIAEQAALRAGQAERGDDDGTLTTERQQPAPVTGGINLDAVLQRRRA